MRKYSNLNESSVPTQNEKKRGVFREPDYGDKAWIGVMVASSNTVVEQEFNAMAPPGVSVHATRLLLTEGSEKALRRMVEDTEHAARLLATAVVDIIGFGCTTGSLVYGLGWDLDLISRIEKVTGIPATTTSTAVISAFKRLGISKVAVATPYNDELNELERVFFEAHGIRVINMKGLNNAGEEAHRASPELTADLVREVNSSEAEAVFISCAGFKSITVIEKLEKELQKFVFSSNTALFWNILEKLNIQEKPRGYGSLFEH